METKQSYEKYNGRIRAFDGSYYRIVFPYSERGRPLGLGEVNFLALCSECRRPISQVKINSVTCGADKCKVERNNRMSRDRAARRGV